METKIQNTWFQCLELSVPKHLRLMIRNLCFLLGLLATVPSHAAPKPGDILVLSSDESVRPALLVIDPKTGNRSSLSDFEDPAQGPQGELPAFLVVSDDGHIYVSDPFSGALFSVDPMTGHRTIISDTFFSGYTVIIDKKGQLITISSVQEGGQFRRAVIRIDPKTGTKTPVLFLSDLLHKSEAELVRDFDLIGTVALERNGNLLVGVFSNLVPPDVVSARLFRFDPIKGTGKLLSSFADPSQGLDTVHLMGGGNTLAVEKSGRILALSALARPLSYPIQRLIRINQRTGFRTIASDFSDPAQGTYDVDAELFALAIEKSGDIIVATAALSPPDFFLYQFGSILRVDPKTGFRTTLSDGRNPAQGPVLKRTSSIAIIPKCWASRRGHSSQ